ncbi:orotidine-5'-phosphate decarboxylase [Magnetofaba australis]|uniref:Orotidine 5'-phosphate decarboxylase n=1 Tax=Magnetofaba australis IT-1 TaxID=1434232 RepID=A0A1Y2K1G7_9PROT|nr:orotidine-5'-phosphate decarboxylase [Magnetofaba australis]OSM01848.1 putative orotidine-5'-phosphate decarboxylase [Magnetofaba australis IT-1]
MADKPLSAAKGIPSRDRLIFAMDVPDQATARAMAQQLGDAVTVYKLGLEMFLSGDYFELVEWLQGQGKKVFADLKLFDVPETVRRATKQLAGRGIHFLTVHGNDGIMQAAASEKGDMKILAVTALTSLDRGDLDDLGFQCDVADLVASRAKRALACGCDGVISSGLEAPMLRDRVDHQLLVITPGIRPVENRPADDQKRVVTVEDAFRNGADYIVVGRPIKNAEDPRAAAEGIQQTIASMFD